MNIKQKVTTLIVAGIMSIGVGLTLMPASASAADCKPDAKNGTTCCGGAKVSILGCSQKGGAKDVQGTGVWALLLIILNIMTAGVGILAVGGIVYASVLYSSSSDNAEQTKRAKDIIKSTSIGIIAYACMYIALNFLIPGGVFK